MTGQSDDKGGKDKGHNSGLDRGEQRQVEKNSRAGARVVYQTVRKEGDEELARPAVSLWWSGVAAGIGISSSILVQAYLQVYVPDSPWRPLIVKFGYATGFLIAVLGRVQLFTENTITAVLPVLADRQARSLWLMLRLWGVVLASNFVGTAAVSVLTVGGIIVTPEQLANVYALSLPIARETPWDLLVHAIPAGFLIAAMVWMVAASRDSAFSIVTMMTYIIALAGFPHIVAGSVEVFVLMFSGQVGIGQGLFGVLCPVLIGNCLGGTGLFALLAYGQVSEEI